MFQIVSIVLIVIVLDFQEECGGQARRDRSHQNKKFDDGTRVSGVCRRVEIISFVLPLAIAVSSHFTVMFH
jgi:hypothetical protein